MNAPIPHLAAPTVAPDLDYARHPAFTDVDRWAPPSASCDALRLHVDRLFSRACDPTFRLDERELAALDAAFAEAARDLPRSDPVAARFAEGMLAYAKQLALQDLETPRLRARHLPRCATAESAAIAERMYAEGHCFHSLEPDEVERLQAAVADEYPRLRAHAESGETAREKLSRNQWDAERMRIFASVFGKPRIVEALGNYMGREVAFDGLAFELSIPGIGRWLRYGGDLDNLRTIYYHLDRTSHAPKGVFYLCEVGEDDGPTTLTGARYSDSPFECAVARAMDNAALHRIAAGPSPAAGQPPGHLFSHRAGRAAFASLPSQLRQVGHFGNDVPAGSEAERAIVGRERRMLGPAGTGVLFDGALVPHRGGIVTTGRRLAFQVIYRCKGARNDAE